MQDILKACEDLEEVRFAPGDRLLTEGQSGNLLYILIEGEVSVAKGTTEITRVSDPGAVFGEISALLGIPFSASVVARSPVRAFLAPTADAFIADHPAIAVHTARLLARRLYDATTYLSDLKAQFEDQSGHFGMMDMILESLLQQQPKPKPPAPRSESDSRV